MVLALVALLFGTLTVEVDREAIRLRLGVGLIRKRIVLTEVQGWESEGQERTPFFPRNR